MEYRRRIVDDELDSLMPHLGAIALEGAKGVGKTATGTQRAATTLLLSDPSQRDALSANLDLVTDLPGPVLIDEWQLEPAVWDRVRRAVDDDPSGGRFLLAGSAGVHPDARIHSGAGRIVRMAMRPMTFSERGLVAPTTSIGQLFEGRGSELGGESPIGVATYAEEILRSGFPGIRDLPGRARRLQLDGYLERIIDRDLPENGVEVRRPRALRAWMSAYAAATSTTANYTAILKAATAGEGDKPARQTVAIYREHLERLFILDPIEAWLPSLAPLKRLTLSPKHHLVDPALAARLMAVDMETLIRGGGSRITGGEGSLLGALFESLATQTVRVAAQAVDARVGHLRTKNGDHEIDLIIESSNGHVLAAEVKLAATIDDRDVRHLLWLRDQIPDRVIDTIVITTGPYAYRRPDGVGVVPLALLGP